jgi:hypothetical protein
MRKSRSPGHREVVTTTTLSASLDFPESNVGSGVAFASTNFLWQYYEQKYVFITNFKFFDQIAILL